MTVKDIQTILLYHNKSGFRNDLRDIYSRITDLKASDSEKSSSSLQLAVSKNKSVTSTVEREVIKNLTVIELEVKARSLERFIKKLDWVIVSLPPNEQLIVKLRYFNKDNTTKEFRYVAAEADYSEDWCERLDKKALKRIANELIGAEITWNS
jgi:DNA-directed RNA polymerase specialized sigma subunit